MDEPGDDLERAYYLPAERSIARTRILHEALVKVTGNGTRPNFPHRTAVPRSRKEMT